jgi:hypothetical protein
MIAALDLTMILLHSAYPLIVQCLGQGSTFSIDGDNE